MARRTLQKEESLLWQRVTEDVTPLSSSSGTRVTRPSQPSVSQLKTPKQLPSSCDKKKIFFSVERTKRASSYSLLHRERPHMVGVRPVGIDNTQWTRLIKGKMAINAKLDLHGYTVQDAFEIFCAFMVRAGERKWRCVEIVTGLGRGPQGGMIRQELPHWLQRVDIRPMVLSVVHTHAGNYGAVRILLRKH